MYFDYKSNISSSSNTCIPTFRLYDREVSCLINSYPKEWLINEIQRDELLKYDLADVTTFEPFWKLILGNKALLPLLWSMFPNHPNLLPAFYDEPTKYGIAKSTVEKQKWIAKPLFGREGIGILRSSNYTKYDDFVNAASK